MSSRRASALEANLDDVAEPVRSRVMIFRLFVALGGRLRTLMDRHLEPLGLTTQQAACLMIAGVGDSPRTPSDIARILGVSHQNVRQLVDALVDKGLVEVRVDRADRRSKHILPTRAARKILSRRNDDDYAVVSSWFECLDEQETRVLLGLLLRVAADLADGSPPGVTAAEGPASTQAAAGVTQRASTNARLRRRAR